MGCQSSKQGSWGPQAAANPKCCVRGLRQELPGPVLLGRCQGQVQHEALGMKQVWAQKAKKKAVGSYLLGQAIARRFSNAEEYLPQGVSIADLTLGVQLACLAYTDDECGTVDSLGGTKKSIETITGGPEQARLPLTDILGGLGYHVDQIFSHCASPDACSQ
ncbi:unnamed protein product, partial [Polarella glacialis]